MAPFQVGKSRLGRAVSRAKPPRRLTEGSPLLGRTDRKARLAVLGRRFRPLGSFFLSEKV